MTDFNNQSNNFKTLHELASLTSVELKNAIEKEIKSITNALNTKHYFHFCSICKNSLTSSNHWTTLLHFLAKNPDKKWEVFCIIRTVKSVFLQFPKKMFELLFQKDFFGRYPIDLIKQNFLNDSVKSQIIKELKAIKQELYLERPPPSYSLNPYLRPLLPKPGNLNSLPIPEPPQISPQLPSREDLVNSLPFGCKLPPLSSLSEKKPFNPKQEVQKTRKRKEVIC